MIYLTQLVYVHPGKQAVFHEFEDVAIPLIAKHGGELLLRIRPNEESVVASHGEVPYEVHLLRFQSEEDFAKFARDEERQRFLHLKNESVRAALLVKGTAL
ncbi:MAG TPA: hypothetical protein VNO21_22640 [Polyangiaceae bacterium]|nr:hypothetical protein [Polyangiaceae bacterium]